MHSDTVLGDYLASLSTLLYCKSQLIALGLLSQSTNCDLETIVMYEDDITQGIGQRRKNPKISG